MTSEIPLSDIVDRIIAILRRDLMLGSSVELAGDTPLFNSDLDLDSLDALLLIQSIEKEFGFKVSSEAFGPDIFKDVNRLAQFTQELRLDANRTVAE